MLRKFKSSILAVLALVSVSFHWPAAHGQVPQADLMRQLKETQTAMKEYASTHDHFPNGVEEFDDCLKMLVKKVNLGAIDSTVAIKTDGKYRCYGQFAISIDYSQVPMVNGVPKLPDFISAPPNSIVLNSDSQQTCWGWVAGLDGKPVQTKDHGPIFFEETITKKNEKPN